MRRGQAIAILMILLVGVALAALLLRSTPAPLPGAGEGEGAGVAVEQGPHGGRVLRDGALTAELGIFERGTPPELRLYVADDGNAVPAADVTATVTLTRLAGRSETYALQPRGDFLASDRPVAEPHSFDVALDLRVAGREHRWTYPSYEGRVVLDPDAAARAGIEVATAGPAMLETKLRLNGPSSRTRIAWRTCCRASPASCARRGSASATRSRRAR